jgi:hypothetical protein
MVKVTCEKTGVEFEAATKRTKNHPQIMGWINDAYKDGWYAQCLDAIKDGREAGLDRIEDFLSLLAETEKAAKAQQQADYSATLAEKRAAKEARRQRFILNSFLREHGCRWRNVGFADEEEADAFDINATVGNEWCLFDSEGNATTVRAAMQQIARSGSKFAQEWLAERNIPMEDEQPASEPEEPKEVVKAREAALVNAAYQALVDYEQPKSDVEQYAHDLFGRLSSPLPKEQRSLFVSVYTDRYRKLVAEYRQRTHMEVL